MNGQIFVIVGLNLNFIGSLLVAFSFEWKQGKEKRGDHNVLALTIGPNKGLLRTGITLLSIGFLLQIIGVLFFPQP